MEEKKANIATYLLSVFLAGCELGGVQWKKEVGLVWCAVWWGVGRLVCWEVCSAA